MKKILLSTIIFNLLLLTCFADDFYWVGNSGNWSDYQNHWATTSNGTVMHDRIPDSTDNVIFDNNSFTEAGHIVAFDIDSVHVGSLNFENVLYNPEILGTETNNLFIYDEFILADKSSMAFNYFGRITFKQSQPSHTLSFDPSDHNINANVFVNINQGELQVLSDLMMPQRRLNVYEGTLNLTGNNMHLRHFNIGESPDQAASVQNPGLSNVDSLYCFGSLYFDSQMDLSEFNADVFFNAQLQDDNYIYFGNNSLNSNLIFTTQRKYYLLSDISTSKDIRLPMSGEFHSQNHNITCKTFSSIEAMIRHIYLGTSDLTVSYFSIDALNLNLNSTDASLFFHGNDTMIFNSNKYDLEFENISVTYPGVLIWDGFINSENLTLTPGLEFYLEDQSVLIFNNLDANGTCSDYIEIRAICDENIQEEGFCVNVLPVFQSASVITANYLKLFFINSDGDFTAQNSFDEGGNQGWDIFEPTDENVLFWVGNSGNWNDSDNWSFSSGGAAGACIPSKKSHVIFDDQSFAAGDSVFFDGFAYSASMTWQDIPENIVFNGNGNLFITDSITLNSNLTVDFSDYIFLESTEQDTINIITDGVDINAKILINGEATWNFTDNLILNNEINLISGHLAFLGGDNHINNFTSLGSEERTVKFDSITLSLNGSDEIWNISNENITINSSGSEIIATSNCAGLKVFNGADFEYHYLTIDCNSIYIKGSNKFEKLNIFEGNSVYLESGATTELDSIQAAGSCELQISLLSHSASNPAVIKKLGFDTLQVEHFFIRNISADTIGEVVYKALQSNFSGNTEGWMFSDTIVGKTYHWLGVNDDWHDIINWESEGLPAVCIPGIRDTVVVDSLIFESALTNTMSINKNAFCASFIADNLGSELNIELAQNLNIREAADFCENVKIAYSEPSETFNPDYFAYGLNLMPDSVKMYFNPNNAEIDVNVFVNAGNASDTVSLLSDLVIDNKKNIEIISGTFSAVDKVISCGVFKTSSDELKDIDISESNLFVYYNLDIQENPIASVLAVDSEIVFPGNNTQVMRFKGGAQSFDFVHFEGISGSNDNLVFLENSNYYNVFSVGYGVNLFIENSTTQTVDSAFNISGTCQDYITINSFMPGEQFTFINNNYSDTIICANIYDLNFASNAVAMLSFDQSNNSGIVFDATKAADADFISPDPSCVGIELVFDNTSTSMWGESENLTYEWFIQNNSVSVEENLEHVFDFSGDYIVKLVATDTISGCFDEFTDTLTVYNHTINLASSNFGAPICEGDTVTFTATSDNATEFIFYLNDEPVDLGSLTENVFVSDTLNNGDYVRVEALYEGCVKVSNTITIEVNPKPFVSLDPPLPADEVCMGTTVSLTASGTDSYRFTVNGEPVGSFSANPVFSSSSLTDQSIVSVVGKSEDGCLSESNVSYTITILENPELTLVSDITPPEICQGESIEFTASGAVEYEFFINGISQTELSVSNSFVASELQNGDVVTVEGFNNEGCSAVSNSITATVNPTPHPTITSNVSNAVICAGETVVFTGSGADEYDFLIDGISQTGFGEQNTYSVDNLEHNQEVTLIGRIGTCENPADTTIVFSVFPFIELQVSEQEFCLNETVTFTAAGDSIYQFFVDGVAATDLSETNTFETANLTNQQMVTVQGTPGACSFDTIYVTVNPLPEISITASEQDLTICEGDQIEFTATGAFENEFFVDGVSQGELSQLNSFATTTITDGQVVSADGYSVFGCYNVSENNLQITVNDYPEVSLTADPDVTQICQGDNVAFLASGADYYEFFIDGISQGEFSAENEFSTSYLITGQTVSVWGSTDNCVSEAPENYSFTVFSVPSVSIEAISPISVCEFDTISFLAEGATEYEFFVNSVSQGPAESNNIFSTTSLQDGDLITVTGYQNICYDEAEDTIAVNVNPIPDLDFTSSFDESGICFGDTAEFFVSGAAEFQFFVDELPIGEQSSDGYIAIPRLEDGQIITVTGFNNACAAAAENYFEMNVNFIDIQISTSSDINSICEGEDITVFAEGGDFYEFFLNDVLLASQEETDVTVSDVQQGDYILVSATDYETNCTFISEKFYINVTEITDIYVSPDNTFCENDSVNLLTNAEGEFLWYRDSEIMEGINEASIYVNSPGSYFVYAGFGSENSVYSSGANAFGQLGTGGTTSSVTKRKASLDVQVKNISAGQDFVVALDVDNNVWAWGNNAYGNIGNGTFAPVYTPVLIESVSDIWKVKAGYHHVLALKTDGTIKTWGKNSSGQLGYGNFASSNFPVSIDTLENIIQVAAGKNHSLALTENGKVYAWGNNDFGQLGVGNYETYNTPHLIDNLDDISYIAAGANHSFAISTSGTVFVWGANDNGQLGLNNFNTSNIPVVNKDLLNIVKIDGGMQHSIASNVRGEVFAWGGNSNGQTGLSGTNILTPQLLDVDGAVEISCGHYSSYVLRTDGTVFSWGLNNEGQLGNGNTDSQTSPAQASEFFGIKQISAGKNFVSAVWAEPGFCASEAQEIIMEPVPEVTISRSEMTLTTIEGEYYQWFFNGSPIHNSNSQSITIQAEGEYAVLVEFANGCSAFSDEYSFYLDIEEWLALGQSEIFPNPNNGEFELILNMPIEVLQQIQSLSIYSVDGALVKQQQNFNAEERQILRYSELAPGLYYIVISSSAGNINMKLVIID